MRFLPAAVTALLATPLLATAPMSSAGANPGPSDPVTTRIDRYLKEQIQDSAIPGAAVALTRGEQVLMGQPCGCDPGHLTGVTNRGPHHAQQQCLTRP